MAKRTNDLEKRTYNAEEALNLIISEDYSFGTSSSEDSSQSSSSYDSINGNSLSPSPILKKAKKTTGVKEERSEEDMLFRHGETSTLGVLETHSTHSTQSTLPFCLKLYRNVILHKLPSMIIITLKIEICHMQYQIAQLHKN